jgi:Kdo2-lipid IVA lauroyltransferase/acyltransferase
MVRLLRKGWLVGVLIDQGTNRAEGVECTFFGKKVFTTPVAALLARRYDCPVVPGYCVRDRDGSLSIIFKPPLRLQKTNNAEADLLANTQFMNDAIEECIRECPDQWFWFHKRWKRHYPHLYPEDLARKRRKRERRREKKLGAVP